MIINYAGDFFFRVFRKLQASIASLKVHDDNDNIRKSINGFNVFKLRANFNVFRFLFKFNFFFNFKTGFGVFAFVFKL